MPISPNASILQIHKALHSREISAQEILEAHIQRISALDSNLGSYITTTFEHALEQAKDADKAFADGNYSYLTGIPMQLKDNISTRDILTTCGSKMLSNYYPPYNATVANHLENAGSVLLGKGNMDEFAMGSSNETSAFKPVRNPWNNL